MAPRMSARSVPHPPEQRLVVRLVSAFHEFHSDVITDISPAQHISVIVPDCSPRDCPAVFGETVVHDYFLRNEKSHVTNKYNPRFRTEFPKRSKCSRTRRKGDLMCEKGGLK